MIILVFIQFFWYDFSFYFIQFFIVGEILQPISGHVQGKGILIAGMAPDLSYDNTRSERLIFFGNEMKIKLVANTFYRNSSRFRSFPVSQFQFLFRFSFLDHYNSSSSSLKTTTDNSSSRFNFRNENYTDLLYTELFIQRRLLSVKRPTVDNRAKTAIDLQVWKFLALYCRIDCFKVCSLCWQRRRLS